MAKWRHGEKFDPNLNGSNVPARSGDKRMTSAIALYFIPGLALAAWLLHGGPPNGWWKLPVIIFAWPVVLGFVYMGARR